jgi:hypothetical protein
LEFIMASKAEISDDTIARLVKDHLERMSDEGKIKRHVKKHGAGYVKLTAAIGALTVAINGYATLQEDNLTLAKQNRVLFQAVATKVNGMAEKLAYIEGRMEGLKPGEAVEAAEEKIRAIEPSTGASSPAPPRKAKTKKRGKKKEKVGAVSGAPEAMADFVMTESDIVQVQRMMPPALKVDAYERLPERLSDLIELEAQAQEQAQEQVQEGL